MDPTPFIEPAISLLGAALRWAKKTFGSRKYEALVAEVRRELLKVAPDLLKAEVTLETLQANPKARRTDIAVLASMLNAVKQETSSTSRIAPARKAGPFAAKKPAMKAAKRVHPGSRKATAKAVHRAAVPKRAAASRRPA